MFCRQPPETSSHIFFLLQQASAHFFKLSNFSASDLARALSSTFWAVCANSTAYFSRRFPDNVSACEGQQAFTTKVSKHLLKKTHSPQVAFQIFLQFLER
jgi:hypothetical protein